MVKLRLKVPAVLTVGVPTLWPLKLTSTFSPGLKPEPLAVTDAPARPEDVDNDRAGCAAGVWVVSGVVVAPAMVVGVGVRFVVWPAALVGSMTRPANRT